MRDERSFRKAVSFPVFGGQKLTAVPDFLVPEVSVPGLVLAWKMDAKAEAGLPHFLRGQNERRPGLG